MLADIIWGFIGAVIIAAVVYWEYRRRNKNTYYIEVNEETEKQIAIERERSRRHPPGGKGL